MPISMPKNALITIQKRNLPPNFSMPQMEQAEEHYTMSLIKSGDRRILTPYQQFDAHAGEVTMMPPQMYHRTYSLSKARYISYMIKISPRLAEAFCSEIDATVWTDLFEQKHLTFRPEDTAFVETMMQDMLSVYEQKAPYRDTLLRGMFFRFVIFLWQKNTAPETRHFRSRLSIDMMDAMYYIEQHASEDLKLRDVAASAGFSEGHFSRLFSSQIGTSFSQYLIHVRIRHAQELLLNTSLSISEIALNTGFSTADYFSTCFKRIAGITPLAYRKQES